MYFFDITNTAVNTIFVYIYTSENPVRKSINPTTTTAVRGKDMLFIKEFVYRIFFTLNILVCVECHDIIVHDCMPKW